MGDIFPHFALRFTKNYDAFYDVLQSVLRRNTLHFTML